jgi:polyribonucleotide nucleotidyltransferase
VGKTYLGKVVRIVDFGAFVEIFPGTDGLLHISEISENRIKQVRDELKEGDQILVKVLAVEGNRIKLSRKAILKEQRAKMGGGELPEGTEAPEESGGQVAFEGGHESADEPNFNREGSRPPRPGGGGDRGPRRGGPGGGRGGDRGGRGRGPRR